MTVPIAEIHSELFHYTGVGGLEGIIKNQTLRATHAAFLNDAMELRAFEARLSEILRVPFEQHGAKEKVAKECAEDFVTGMYNTLLGTKDVQPNAEFYVTSFCKALTEKVAQHGLLSQWRGYGKDGSYAIVFDTAKLELLLTEEVKKWGYDLFSHDVIYSSDTEEKICEKLGADFKALQNNIAQFIESNGDVTALEEIYYPFIHCACRYKHWGFHEEEEVRIIAIPPNKKLYAAQQARDLVVKEKPRRHFIRAGTPVPCIDLFEGITNLSEKSLPITRIIVGPHRDKDKRQRAVENLLAQYGLKIPVTVSEIPYI